MRQVTATEKFRAVNEGKMAKGEFVRQMRMAYPSVISQWNSFNDTVTILKNRGYITEKTGVESYDSRYDLNISSESIDRGVRYELAAQGQDPATVTDKELVAKVTDRVVKNLKKDPLHYINLLAKESSHVDKNDKMKETKRGAEDVDTFNGMKKADLKENADIDSARENIVKVASVIRAKYSEIPGFNVILKDFLQTHQNDIKAGLVTDPVGEFDDYIELNYDRLDEKEGKDHDGDGDIDGDDYMMAKDKAIKKAMGKDEVVSEMSPEMADVVAFLATGAGIQGASHVAGKLLKALETGRFGEKGKEIAQDIHNLAKTDVEEVVNERVGGKDDIIELIKDRAMNSTGDEQAEVLEVTEFMARHYFGNDLYEFLEQFTQEVGIDIEFGRLGDTLEGKNVNEVLKNIITKVLEEQMINEAATNELARLAEDYEEFPGMKQSIIALQDIVTDIESFYDKTREKIQKVYDSIGEIRNEEGLKVGGFIAPSIEAAFNKDLRPVTKVGFTGGLETPKVKTLSQADIARVNAGGELEEEPKQNVFAPISESKKKK
jgi:hypothetical protein